MADVEGSGEDVGAPLQHAAAVEASLGGEKTTSLIIETTTQTDGQCAAESDPPAGATTGKKKRMPAQHVSYILAMPIEKPEEFVLPSFLRGDNNMAEKMGVTEEWLEDRRRMYRESAVRTQRVHDDFVKYQAEIRDELFEKGYVEVDDDYFTGRAEIQEETRARWKELKKKRDPTIKFVDYGDSNVPYDYEEQARHVPYDYEEQARRLVAL